jgi:hypothetical protein
MSATCVAGLTAGPLAISWRPLFPYFYAARRSFLLARDREWRDLWAKYLVWRETEPFLRHRPGQRLVDLARVWMRSTTKISPVANDGEQRSSSPAQASVNGSLFLLASRIG